MPYTVLLTSSNARGDLDAIKVEFKDLEAHFGHKRLDGIVSPKLDYSVTEQSIFNASLQSADIRLFHYSGHAGDRDLLDGNGQLVNGNIIAFMMREAKNLRLVFLNGCATKSLVDGFLECGANLVIATKAEVLDSVASKFSSFFYEILCTTDSSIGEAFTGARIKLKQFVTDRFNEKNKEQNKNNGAAKNEENFNKILDGSIDNKEYLEMLKSFFSDATARRISSKANPAVAGDSFEWGIYCKNENERQEYENWKLVIGGEEEAMPFTHPEPGLHFLQKLAKSAYDIQGTLNENDARYKAFDEIKDNLKNADDWGSEATNNLATTIKKILMVPMREPFEKLHNCARDSQSQLKSLSPKVLKEYLGYQLELYRAFMRTSILIMLSNYMESAIRVDNSGNNLQVDFGLENHELQPLINDLLNEVKDLNDIEFSIQLSRNIHSLLSQARDQANAEDKKLFKQFVGEYHGNTVGTKMETAFVDLNHSVLINLAAIFDKSNATLDQLTGYTLRSYCDKAETALIELFKDLRYVLKYDIVTIAKVEANRQRDKIIRTFNHDILSVAGTSFYDTDSEFIENYSVVLATHRNNLNNRDYLSLSPFMIDVGAFLEQEKSVIFYFTRVANGYLEYTYYGGRNHQTLKIKIDCPPDQRELLISCPVIDARYKDLNDRRVSKVLLKFARVRDQFNIMMRTGMEAGQVV